MAIARVGTPTSAALTASGGSYTLSKPTGVAAGDLLIITEVHETTTVTTSVTGFTQRDAVNDGTTLRMTVLYRIVDGSEGASFTVSLSGNTKGVCICRAYSGVDGTTPFSSSVIANETVTGTTHTAPSNTPGSANDWALSAMADKSTTSASKNTNWTVAAGGTGAVEWLEANNNTAASAPWFNLVVIDENGATGNTTARTHSATSTISQNNAIMWSAALNPAAAGTTTYPQRNLMLPASAVQRAASR